MREKETLLLGMAVGAGLMYLLDPDRGGRRRALVRDQITRAGHDLEDIAQTTARRVRNRTVGIVHEARANLTEHDVDDIVLVERVRSEIGRDVSHPGAIDVTADTGTVTLRGDVHADEVQRVVRKAKSVRGVKRVDNQLRAHTDASSTPGLQAVETR